MASTEEAGYVIAIIMFRLSLAVGASGRTESASRAGGRRARSADRSTPGTGNSAGARRQVVPQASHLMASLWFIRACPEDGLRALLRQSGSDDVPPP